MKQAQHNLTINSGAQGLYEVTREIAAWLAGLPIRDGLLTVFIQHTSASLLIQENADQDMLRDIENFFKKLVPEDSSLYRHTSEGDDDMPAHIKGGADANAAQHPGARWTHAIGRVAGHLCLRTPPGQGPTQPGPTYRWRLINVVTLWI